MLPVNSNAKYAFFQAKKAIALISNLWYSISIILVLVTQARN